MDYVDLEIHVHKVSDLVYGVNRDHSISVLVKNFVEVDSVVSNKNIIVDALHSDLDLDIWYDYVAISNEIYYVNYLIVVPIYDSILLEVVVEHRDNIIEEPNGYVVLNPYSLVVAVGNVVDFYMDSLYFVII